MPSSSMSWRLKTLASSGVLLRGVLRAGDGIGVGGVVGVVGVGVNLKRIQRNGLFFGDDGGRRRFGTSGGRDLGGERNRRESVPR